ncbi:putative F-box protein [Prunus yedoensis var. nudiflora]|uniref:Putative F-box protein n=1 Tax=Prunus yedoensis var. nudiflora TaxID=2094558 RepID=A0A314Y8D0_PRUYE|nr:putative F-box protein [Prunus yedoensis var. nudiflora]
MAWFVHPLTLTLFSYLTLPPESPSNFHHSPCNRNPQGLVTYRFGYIPSTNEYKVLQILSFRLDSDGKWDLQFNTFTLGRDSWWRPLQVDPRDLPFDALAYAYDSHNNLCTYGSVCLNGAVLWIYEKQKLIVAFDVRGETFKAIPLSEDYDKESADYFDLTNQQTNAECR